MFLGASRIISMAGWAAPDPAISMILEAPRNGKKTSGFKMFRVFGTYWHSSLQWSSREVDALMWLMDVWLSNLPRE
jgi:hypothetical protein